MAKKTNNSPSTRSYVIGFVLSVLLTLLAFVFAGREGGYWSIVFALLVLAATQTAVQLYFFLHLGEEKSPRWRLSTFVFAAGAVIIVVFGSIWIMQNLDYHHGHKVLEEDINNYIQNEEGIYKNNDH